MSNRNEIANKLKKLLGDIDQQKFGEITWT